MLMGAVVCWAAVHDRRAAADGAAFAGRRDRAVDAVRRRCSTCRWRRRGWRSVPWRAVSTITWVKLVYSSAVRDLRRLHHLVRRGAGDRQRAHVGVFQPAADRRDAHRLPLAARADRAGEDRSAPRPCWRASRSHGWARPGCRSPRRPGLARRDAAAGGPEGPPYTPDDAHLWLTMRTVKSHYYSQHAGALRAELGAAISREQMRDLHRKQPARHLAVAARQFAILAIATWALIRFDHPLDLDSARGRAGLHGLQFHDPAARGRAPHDFRSAPSARRAAARLPLRDPERHLGEPVHALAPRSSRRARLRRGRSQAASPVAEGQRALVQAALLHAGAVPDLLPRGAPRVVDLSRSRCSARSRASGSCRCCSTSRCWRSSGTASASTRRCAPASSRCSSSSRSRSR